MKKLLVSFMLVAPMIAFADNEPFPTSLRGVHIVPMAQQEISSDRKNDLIAKQMEEKTKGYKETDGENTRYLMSIRPNASYQLKASREKDYGVYDTRLKDSYTDIKLNFTFKGVAGVQNKEVIGYAAIGSFEKDGWDGIKEIFANEMGNCAYSHMKIAAVQLAKESTEYLVNKKPSNKVIEGNQNVGFLYTINWYTDQSMNTLECVNKSFKPEIMTKMIALANKIDKG